MAQLYARLDAERVWVSKALDAAMSDSSATGPESRWLRDATVDTWADRRRRLRVADNGLCFGRIDTERDGPLHVGRIGLTDADDESRALLTDWRAPIARPFYTATGANPEGISLRRHFRNRGRTLLDYHDESFAGNARTESDTSDEALLAAVSAARTDGMRDIVATIQAAQDEVIRLGDTGVVVIEGGPGTGKTAVALHRVAYLLYSHRERMARSGVLLAGVRTSVRDSSETARVKGSEAMVAVLEAAVLDRQVLPDEPLEIPLDDVTVWLDTEVASAARDAARASRLVHNQARAVFDHHVIEALTLRAVAAIGSGWLGSDQPDAMDAQISAEFGEPAEDDGLAETLTANVRAELSGSSALEWELDQLWPMLTPQRLLADLLSSPDRLETAAASLSEADRAALYRRKGHAWTISDVPLLDEAVDMVGSDGTDLPPILDEDDEVEEPDEHLDY